jgi:hypothetical protein
MDPNTDRDYGDSEDDGYFYEDAHDQHGAYDQRGVQYRAPDYYWRRRFLVLAGGLTIVALITVGLSALLGPAKPLSPRGASPASLAVRDTPPVAGAGTATGSDSPAGDLAPGGTRSASSAGAVPSRQASSSLASSRTGTCSQSAMVLSLFTAKAEYGPAEEPQFEVYAVSTAPGTCTLAFGPSSVRVVVVWHGQVLWDSAQCPLFLSKHGVTATQPVRFTQGVPQVADLSWNREARSPGCAGSVPARASGRVNAVVLAAGKSSPARPFTLLR